MEHMTNEAFLIGSAILWTLLAIVVYRQKKVKK